MLAMLCLALADAMLADAMADDALLAGSSSEKEDNESTYQRVFLWSHTCFSQLLKNTIPFSFHKCNGGAISLSSG